MPPKKTKKDIQFHYIKTAAYRTFHVDGAYGGLTPNGQNMYMEVFVERNTTPQMIIQELNIDGTLEEPPKKVEGKTGIVREIECGIVFNIGTAVALRDWLNKRIEEHNNITEEINKTRSK